MSRQLTEKQRRALTQLAANPDGLLTYDPRFLGSGDYKHLVSLAERHLVTGLREGRHGGNQRQLWQITEAGYAALAEPLPAARRRGLAVTVLPDDEDGGWAASVRSRPGIMAQGGTAAEALRSLADALEAADELERELGI